MDNFFSHAECNGIPTKLLLSETPIELLHCKTNQLKKILSFSKGITIKIRLRQLFFISS